MKGATLIGLIDYHKDKITDKSSFCETLLSLNT